MGRTCRAVLHRLALRARAARSCAGLLGLLLAAAALAEPAPVQQIVLVGNQAIGSAELHALVADFEGRVLGPEQLEDLRRRITEYYIGRGYINSGALIEQPPDAAGRLSVRIVEGRLSAVRLEGLRHYDRAWLERQIWPEPQAPLRLDALQDKLQLLLQEGALARVNAQLLPGAEPGQAVLDAKVDEGPRFHAGLSVADDRPVSVGEVGGTLTLAARNLSGYDDSGSLAFGKSSGYTDYDLHESVPLGTPRLDAFVHADSDHGDIVQSSLSVLGVVSQEKSLELGLSGSLLRTLEQHLAVSLSGYYTDTTTYLLGLPFSFTPGVDNGHSRVAAARLAADWLQRGTRQALSVHSAVSAGFGVLGATVHPGSGEPDSRFVDWSSQAQYVHPLWGDAGQLVAKAALQLSSKGLLPSEKASIGGVDSVRGYAVNTLVRDEGGFASLEYRHTVARLALPQLASTPTDGALALAAFYDVGDAKDRGSPQQWISGAGAGVRWDAGSGLSAQLYKGFALHHLDRDSNGLQDRGIYFRFAYDTAF
jgi:hemolysin activation/secretion protein